MNRINKESPGRQLTPARVAALVGKVYAVAPAHERPRMLEQLLRPLGVLALVAVAGGAFARLRAQSGWREWRFTIEDVQQIRSIDVVDLAERVQLVSADALDGFAQCVMASPALAGCSIAALLVALIAQQGRSRRASDKPPERKNKAQ